MAATIIPPPARAVIFDAYGTLFDVHSAVSRHMAEVGPDAARFSETWRAKQLEYSWVLSLAGRYEPFWTLTEKALDQAFARFPAVDRRIRPRLLEAYRALDAYPEAPDTLRALRARGLKTGILSNGDPGMLNAAVASAGLADDLDTVLSVDAVQVFKTSPRTYELVLQALPVTADEVVFVSSNRWDIAGAAVFGFHPVWVNRLALPDEYRELAPRAVISSLGELV
ncbi:haloacid dehalogenase type II [Microvirga sp. CF3016]|uniref:haloacid dehalogenase type II n=1 Tax=Microvirga sp. CF3016 TaxID=3110181 RepID=UPI002E770FCD|nr:haloacid dehalogenase type II [Microvirga sp. CF3016]MEE1610099.1 haloacid dehalogenase type II [Microvirga sp. CF3016]